jgi:hypothetical protein
MLVPKKPIQLGIIFVEGKVRSLPYREFRGSTRLGSLWLLDLLRGKSFKTFPYICH